MSSCVHWFACHELALWMVRQKNRWSAKLELSSICLTSDLHLVHIVLSLMCILKVKRMVKISCNFKKVLNAWQNMHFATFASMRPYAAAAIWEDIPLYLTVDSCGKHAHTTVEGVCMRTFYWPTEAPNSVKMDYLNHVKIHQFRGSVQHEFNWAFQSPSEDFTLSGHGVLE